MVGDLVALLVDVEIRGSGSVKIAEVVEALAGAELPHRAVRVALGVWKGNAIASPLDLAVGPSRAEGRGRAGGAERRDGREAECP